MWTRIFGLVSFILVLGVTVYFGFFHHPNSGDDWRARDDVFSKLDQRLQGLADQIRAVQGESACDRDTECRIVGIGTPTCGLYKDFLIYSKRDAEESRLLSLVSRFNDEHAKIENLSLAAEKCGSQPARVHCVRQHCEHD